MSDKKYSENDPERTLITLEQLSQTIEVMTSVVNRLRKHLSDQIMVKREIEALEHSQTMEAHASGQQDNELETSRHETREKQESVVVEVSQPESELEEALDEKTLH